MGVYVVHLPGRRARRVSVPAEIVSNLGNAVRIAGSARLWGTRMNGNVVSGKIPSW